MADDRLVRDGGGGGGVRSRWEWVAASVSAALVLAVVGYMLYDGVARPQTPPSITVQADTVLQGNGVWLVQFQARNHGHLTAAQVTVEGELMDGERSVEASEAVLDYVPVESVRRGGLFFTHDPRAHRLQVRAKGYQEP
jgi:uncharacterized protein (TIGR02588 family)